MPRKLFTTFPSHPYLLCFCWFLGLHLLSQLADLFLRPRRMPNWNSSGGVPLLFPVSSLRATLHSLKIQLIYYFFTLTLIKNKAELLKFSSAIQRQAIHPSIHPSIHTFIQQISNYYVPGTMQASRDELRNDIRSLHLSSQSIGSQQIVILILCDSICSILWKCREGAFLSSGCVNRLYFLLHRSRIQMSFYNWGYSS